MAIKVLKNQKIHAILTLKKDRCYAIFYADRLIGEKYEF